jgi:O-antigen/teichoic acid export membrane protein
MPSRNTKRIVKNTIMLYFRMLLIMAVSLFTVRIVFKALGVVDYGIYNLVSGIVVMFSFLSSTMASASQRFFAFELGRNDIQQLRRTFSMTVTIYVIIALVVMLLAETVGLWFLNNMLVIPAERMNAANWIYQFSILSFISTIMTIPYNAAIIAHENMNVYAYVSILEVVLKLVIAYLLVLFSFDKLKLYGLLTFLVIWAIRYIYRTICKHKYEECKFGFYWDKGLFKTLMSYSGWSLFGAMSGILKNQGINVILNMFFGPTINAAKAVAYNVNSAVNQFASNFYTAIRPQITKHFAAGEQQQMMSLVFQSSKLSYFLLFFISMPVLLETNFILTLWLKEPPEYTEIFTWLVIINTLIDSLSYPLMSAAQATGKIKKYQSVVGGMLLFNLPVSYCFLKLGFQPQVTLYVSIVISLICLFLRLLILKGMIDLDIRKYFKKVLLIIFSVSIVAYIIPLFLRLKLEEGFIRFLIVGGLGVITSIAAMYLIGFNVKERAVIIKMVRNNVYIKQLIGVRKDNL